MTGLAFIIRSFVENGSLGKDSKRGETNAQQRALVEMCVICAKKRT
jgi:hypothetical protein